MERNLVKSQTKSMINISESSSAECEETFLDDVDLYEDGDLSVFQRAKILTQSILFWITDAERFRPFHKRPKVIARTCRLLCLKSTTPLELFTRKIENEEYGEALALAQRYNLDCDLVYQQQWRKSPVSVASIQDYLSKIKKRSWVLEECLKRVPKDIDAARELILYGLRGTELDTLVNIAEGTNDDEFLVSDLSLEYEEDLDMDPEEREREAQEWAANDLKLRRELLSKIDFHNLSKEQIEVVRARQILLQYFDRLSSYEVLLGGPHMASERYDPQFYEKFRKQTEVEAAVTMAREGNWRGVAVLFTYHGEVTLPHRLAILSNFPPTMGPYEYSGEIFEWEEDSLRDPDWCEDLLCRKAVGIEADAGLIALYKDSPELEQFRDCELTAEVVSHWYKMRAREMEDSSHFVDASLDLLKLARERNCP
ncbi:Neuroblastoma-amplified sequence, partial [Armadillidium nasatum]